MRSNGSTTADRITSCAPGSPECGVVEDASAWRAPVGGAADAPGPPPFVQARGPKPVASEVPVDGTELESEAALTRLDAAALPGGGFPGCTELAATGAADGGLVFPGGDGAGVGGEPIGGAGGCGAGAGGGGDVTLKVAPTAGAGPTLSVA